MKILLAAGIYPPQIGGPATYAKLLVDELPERGISVRVVKFSDVAHLSKVSRHIAYFLRVWKESREVDIVFAQDVVSVGFPAYWAALLRRKKFFVRMGGDYAWEQAQGRYGVTETLDEFVISEKKYPTPVRMLRFVQTFVAKRADKAIVPSRYLAHIVETWGVPKGKIAVIYNAFNTPSLSSARVTLKHELGLSEHVIISAGRLVKWKGFSTLIDLMPEISKAFIDAHLYIIGDGPERAALEREIKSFDLKDKVTLLGALPREKLLRYVKAADVFVLNTGYEGLSHQLLEAMALGTPIVTTNVGGNVELLEDNITGALVSFNDKKALSAGIREALSATRAVEAMVARAKEKAAGFTTQKMIEKTIAALTQ